MNPKVLTVLAATAVLAGAVYLRPQTPAVAPETPKAAPIAVVPETPAPEVKAAELYPIAAACEQKVIAAEFTGNGRDRMSAMLWNKSEKPIRVAFATGQILQSGPSSVLVVRPVEVEVAGGGTREIWLQTVALRSSNVCEPAPYRLSPLTAPKVVALMAHVQTQPELMMAAVQTAVLAVTENLPLVAVAKFEPAGGVLPSRFNTDAFRVETSEILTALTLLRELGVDESRVAMTVDPQLKIEAMIDPATRASAMNYYGIGPEREWDYWRQELLQGDPSTRHYALYGIARFYPDVALQMLPRWARETRTNPVYRLAAVQALAETQRADALPILRQLTHDLASTPELAKASVAAADYLEYRVAQILAARNSQVAFRTSRKQEGAEEL